MSDFTDFTAAVPRCEVGMVAMEIGNRNDLSEQVAQTAAKAWRVALQTYPHALFNWSLSGYDNDPREIWEIPEAVRFVRWWAEYAGMDDFETASRVFGSDPLMCVGGLAACGVFGEEVRRRVIEGATLRGGGHE
jgi:hypothetical protein